MKQEQLEELAKDFYSDENQLMERIAFKRGYTECKENSYSEEEAKKLAFDFYYDMSHKMGVTENLISENSTNVDIWFEEYKNNDEIIDWKTYDSTTWSNFPMKQYTPPYVREEPKIQRNEPCPCNSGKKYKKCCINKEEVEI
jgi:uncharacterized protein YecA (UPF0149 family)